MGKAVVLVVLAFAMTLAVIIGLRMSAEAMGVAVGVVCGAAAAIPVSMLILLIANQRSRESEAAAHEQPTAKQGTYPPVVVIQAGTPVSSPWLPSYYPSQAIIHEPAQREFRLIGEQCD